jgi:hypothetical protein
VICDSGKNIFGAAAFVASAGYEYEPAAYEIAVKPILNEIPKEGSEE